MNDTANETPRMNWNEKSSDFYTRLAWTNLNIAQPAEGALVHMRGDGTVCSGVYQSGHHQWWQRSATNPCSSVEWAYTSPFMAHCAMRAG